MKKQIKMNERLTICKLYDKTEWNQTSLMILFQSSDEPYVESLCFLIYIERRFDLQSDAAFAARHVWTDAVILSSLSARGQTKIEPSQSTSHELWGGFAPALS